MALRRQTQLLAEMDHHNGRRVRRVATLYRRDVIGPLVTRIKRARGLKDLLSQLGPQCVKAMNTAKLEEEVAGARVQMGVIGRVSALPKDHPQIAQMTQRKDG